MRALRIFLVELIAGFALLAAAGAALGGLASQAGRSSAAWDIASHFAPVWLLAGVLALVIGLVAGRGAIRGLTAVLSLVAIVCAGQPILSELQRETTDPAPQDAPHQLKIVQFNAWRDNPDLNGAAAWIAEQDPDVVVIEEASPAMLAAMRRHGRWRVTCERCSVMIFSRAAPTTIKLKRPKGLALPASAAALLPSPAGGSFPVIGVHFTWPTEIDKHRDQTAGLTAALRALPRDRMILVGDFNSTPWSASRRRQDEDLGLERRTKALVTWPARTYERWGVRVGLPLLPIDHVYAGPAWRTISVERGPRIGSDHYPLVAVLALRP